MESLNKTRTHRAWHSITILSFDLVTICTLVFLSMVCSEIIFPGLLTRFIPMWGIIIALACALLFFWHAAARSNIPLSPFHMQKRTRSIVIFFLCSSIALAARDFGILSLSIIISLFGMFFWLLWKEYHH